VADLAQVSCGSMTDLIRECLLDMPLSNMTNRPEGMFAIRRDDVPGEVRPAIDAWVQAHGGHIVEEPLIVVHGGKTPAGGGGAKYYVLPPVALQSE
jgi:hypothetical protein